MNMVHLIAHNTKIVTETVTYNSLSTEAFKSSHSHNIYYKDVLGKVHHCGNPLISLTTPSSSGPY